MRPVLLARRRRLWGISTVAAGALFGLLSAGRPALAALAPVDRAELVSENENDDSDESFKKQVVEVEKGLNDLLMVDEDKKIHVKKEFREGLPVPAERVERMLQMAVKVGDDGKLHLRNPEQLRPFLPQIQGFLKAGGSKALKDLQGKSPEERRAAIEKMMREQGVPVPTPEGRAPKAPERKGPEGKAPETRKDDESEGGRRRRLVIPGPDGERRERPEGRRERPDGERRERPAPAPSRGGSVEERLARIEQRLERLQQTLERMAERGRGDEQRRVFLFRNENRDERGARRGAEGHEERWQAEPWGWRAEPREHEGDPHFDRHWDRGDEEPGEGRRPRAGGARGEEPGWHRDLRREGGREGGPRQFLEGLRQRFQERGGELGGGELREGARDVMNGFRKIQQTLTQDDWDRIRRTVERLRGELKAEDLRDQGALVHKLQDAVAPEDMPRFLEILGEVMGSPEGQGLQRRLEQVMRRFEEFMQSDEGRQLEERMGRLFQGEQSKKLRGTMDKLFRPGERKDDERHEERREKRSSRRGGVAAPRDAHPTNPNARLY